MANSAGFNKFIARNKIGRASARKPGDLPAVKQDQVRAELQKDRSMNRRKKRWKGDDMRPRDPKGVPRVGGGHAPERRWY